VLSIEDKAKIITQAAHSLKTEDSFKEFFYENDVGVPLSQCLEYGLCELTQDGEDAINETWTYLCILCKESPNGYFENIDDLTENILEDEE
jgi:hypothetical protein